MRKTQIGRRELRPSRPFVLFVLLSVAGLARAQQPDPSSSPAGSNNDSKRPSFDPVKNDRIFGVIPNYRTVEDPTQRIAPLTTKQKFRLAVDDSFDPTRIQSPAPLRRSDRPRMIRSPGDGLGRLRKTLRGRIC